MSQLIAGIYELEKKIGAGGGGVVYLGRHTRLDKKVVLKADKRTLSVGTETLRREVDLLKGLSHTYIPQVYDFVQEDGIVYTVMDYIEGESLDKLIARKELPSHAELVGWACQLLEALSYLHNRPPYGILHGDIKPANIMKRSNGDMCLIDFNIALALGEEGAVKVGFSRGYASPEHYGADYLVSNQGAAVGSHSQFRGSSFFKGSKHGEGSEKTVLIEDSDGSAKTELLGEKIGKNTKGTKSTSRTADGKGILLDVRSDIYSLGATLYHLISGKRPAQDAREVEPLGPEICSTAISAILQKSMAPQPAERYQTAEEMLAAFRKLHKQDKRAVRHRRRMLVAGLGITAIFLAGGVSTFIGMKQLEQRKSALALAEYSANALQVGDIMTAVSQALEAIPKGNSILNAPVTAQAQKALTDALGVYDVSDGFKALDTIELPGAPFQITMSPQGNLMAVVYGYEVAIYNVDNMEQLVTLSVQESALSDCFFVDETHIVYAGEQGITGYDLEKETVVWTGEIATTLTLSADRQTVAAVNRTDEHVVFYNTVAGTKLAERSFEGAHLNVPANDIFADAQRDLFALNEDGKLFAVSLNNGALRIMDIYEPENDLILYDESDYEFFSGGFCGKYLAYTAEKSGEAQFGIIDVEEAAIIAGFNTQEHQILQADESGIYLANGNLVVKLDLATMSEQEIAYTDDVNIISFTVGAEHTLVATENGGFSFFDRGSNCMSEEIGKEAYDFTVLTSKYAIVANRNETSLRVLQLENHQNTQLLTYNARYQHDEARISHDKKTAMLFGYENFCIYTMSGELITEVTLPDAEQIYDQQFRRSQDGSWLEVIWYDGMRRCYSASDGSMISEEKGEKPDKDLYEEFETEKYRIASSLHEAPQVYDLVTGEFITSLEEDAYLTYVTQVGDYLVTEYLSTSGGRFGILLNEKFEKLAYLPKLCDVEGDTFVFDYSSGDLRQVSMYSLEELIALGKEYIN